MADDPLGFLHDHAAIAWSHFLAQHEGKPYTEAFVTAFYPPLVELDVTQNELYTKRWIDTAEGVQLDGVGSIVGKTREIPNSVYLPFFGFISQPAGRAFGVARMRFDRDPYAVSGFLGDIEYRVAIYTKIALNNSHGTAEDIMRIVNDVLGITKSTVIDIGNANANLLVNDLTITYADYRASIIDEIIPRAGGVQIWPYLFDLTKTFGFSNQLIYFGFGVGILARLIGSNIPPISIVNNPALTLDFMTTPGTLPSRITYTRTGNATYTDVDGIIQTSAANQPRWDYHPTTHVLKGLLLEEARTNKVWPSNLATGMFLNNVTRVLNAGIAPDGTNSLIKIENTTSNTYHGMQMLAASCLPATVYTCSVYAKKGEIRYLQLIWDDQGGGTPATITTFDLQNNVVSSGAGTITHVGNDIYRCVMTTAATGAATTSGRLGLQNSTIPNPSFYVPAYVGVLGEGTYLWGVQIEQGDYATSYIPTTTAAITRSSDSCTITPENMSPWFQPPGGSWYVEFDYFDATPLNQRTVSIPNPGGGNPGVINLGVQPNRLIGQYDGVALNTTSPATTPNTVIKAVSTWTQNQQKVTVNGGTIFTASNMINGYTTYVTNGVRFLSVSNTMGNSDSMSGHIRHIRYWKEILTNADMTALTAPGVE